MTLSALSMAGFATSVDAPAMGVPPAFFDEPIQVSALVIGLVIYGLSDIGVRGRRWAPRSWYSIWGPDRPSVQSPSSARMASIRSILSMNNVTSTGSRWPPAISWR